MLHRVRKIYVCDNAEKELVGIVELDETLIPPMNKINVNYYIWINCVNLFRMHAKNSRLNLIILRKESCPLFLQKCYHS